MYACLNYLNLAFHIIRIIHVMVDEFCQVDMDAAEAK